jgi:hypothetical protein
LQGARVGRQREERGVGVRLQKVILEHLDAVVQRRVELDHAAGGVEDDPGLPLVGGDADDLGALGPVGQQPYSPSAAARVLVPLPAGIETSPWRGRGSSSSPWTIWRCHGRSRRRRRAPVALGTVT